MKGIVNNYTSGQINNLSKKRKKLNRLIDRLKKERGGKNRQNVVFQLSLLIDRKIKYLSKGA
jgi:hypothetical protein